MPPALTGRLKKAPGAAAGAGTTQSFKFTSAGTLGLAAGLLLALYAFWPALQPLWAPARRGTPPAGETPPVSQAEAAPERTAPEASAGVPVESVIPPGGGVREESSAPPLPGLLMAPPPSLAELKYTGHQKDPAELAKDTAGSRVDCGKGDMFECLRLGWQYNTGYGVKKDIERGFSLINKACAGGVAEACTSQGIMQMSGHGTAQDETAAFALFDKACAAGDMYGCTMLASRYLGDESTPAEISRGLGLLGKACDAKVAVACSFLGTIYAEGRLAPRNAAEADRLLGKACGLQNKIACQLHQQLRSRAAAEKDR